MDLHIWTKEIYSKFIKDREVILWSRMKKDILHYPSLLCAKAYFKMWFYLTWTWIFFSPTYFYTIAEFLLHVLNVKNLFSIRIKHLFGCHFLMACDLMGKFFFNKKDVIFQRHKIYAVLKFSHMHRRKTFLSQSLFILCREEKMKKKTSFALCSVREPI